MSLRPKLNCLIVEDEPLAARILEDYISRVHHLHIVGKCPDAIFAIEALQQHTVDVLFLDIHLPGLKGLAFLRQLTHPPQVILTTAYHEYALEGYELGVVDYLLKPIDFERFIKAVQRLKLPDSDASLPTRAFHFFNINKQMVRVWLDEIMVAESLKEYIRLHLSNGERLVTKGQLYEFEQWLQSLGFLRVHRSYLVATAHIQAYSAAEITLGLHVVIPIGRQYKEAFLGEMAKRSH
jgi:DNA-binding LytR/AlgR family response regulator